MSQDSIPRYQPVPDPRSFSIEMLQRVKARDPEALEALFETYFDRIYGLAYRLMGNRAAAEDVVQDVFLKVYRAAHQLDSNRDPGPWLGTVTYNVCRDFWRSRGHQLQKRSASMDEHPALAAMLSDPAKDPEQVTAMLERERKVQEAINELPPDLREVVVLRDYRGMSHEEVAAQVGASYAAVRKRYSRALARLGKALKDVLR